MAAPPQQLTKVPAGDVGKVVQSFITDDRAKKVTAEKESGKPTWKVKAEF